MATCLNEGTTNMYNNMTVVDVMCPVCRGIFIEPVVMPCHHVLCLQCFQRTMEETSLTCPMCRKRIGSWLRTATKDQNLVNKELWTIIQKRFPEQVEAKLSGNDDGIEEHVVGRVSSQISLPGDIRREYELHMHKLEEESRKKLEAERRASEDLICKIMEEEERHYLAARQQLLDQSAADEQIARDLQKESLQSTSDSGLTVKKEIGGLHVGMDNKENKNQAQGTIGTQIKGPMDSYIIPQQKKSTVSSGKFLTASDSSFSVKFGSSKLKTGPVTELERVRCTSNMSTGSHDSINQEMHHFKPIKSVPRTPPKKLSDGRVFVPMVIKAVPVNLSPLYESLNESSPTEPLISTPYRQQLMKMQMEQMRNLKGVLRTSEMNPPISAFRGGASCWQKKEALKPGSDSSEKEHSTEYIESPRNKACQDVTMEGKKSNFTLAGLSSYSNEECRGKKVIAIVHNQADALVEVGGKIGGHDRRFGGSEEEDNCAFSLVDKVTDRDESDDELTYHDPEGTGVLGVEPESYSQTPTGIRYPNKAIEHGTSSLGVNLKVNHFSLNPSKKTPASHCRNTHHTQRNNIKQAHSNNNNNDVKTAIEPNIHAETRASAVSEKKEANVAEKCKDSLGDDIPFVVEGASLMLSKEQARIEMLIRQEQADLELALRLQREWDAVDRRVDRSKGSLRAYELRNSSKPRTTKKKAAAKREGRGRQSTLEESFTGTLRSTRKRQGHCHNS